MKSAAAIERVAASAYRIPTDAPEADGTFDWDATTLVLTEVGAGSLTGIGYSYTSDAALGIVRMLTPELVGLDACDLPRAHVAMVRQARNVGVPGLAATAISALDNALWDLKGKLLGLSVQKLLGQVRTDLPVYGSGGFTSYSDRQLRDQLGGWAAAGFTRVKMKIGRAPTVAAELERIRAARESIGPDVELFVDANGAYSQKQAVAVAHAFVDLGVSWFEEPVTADDLDGLHLLRNRLNCQVAAGEYGYTPTYFQRMLAAAAVDVLQADATRCLGITGFLGAGELCRAFHLPLSFHCAPALHAAVGCSVQSLIHGEYFHDHARIENLFFDGVPQPKAGRLTPDPDRLGLGLEFKAADAERYKVG